MEKYKKQAKYYIFFILCLIMISRAFAAEICFDKIDNDGDGLIDCFDSECESLSCGTGCTCSNGIRTETICNDLINNDGDNFVGCHDSDCDGIDGCEYETELTCNDGVDNDWDRFADCHDSDCDGIDGCEYETELTCNDGVDNDVDTLTDCADPDCIGQTGPGGGTCESESICDDYTDNDGDGMIDCADPDCIGQTGPGGGTCESENCYDIIDNDGDGMIDCADVLDCPNLEPCKWYYVIEGQYKWGRCCYGVCVDRRAPPLCIDGLDCNDYDGCSSDGCLFPKTCEARCYYSPGIITECVSGDACCPSGCNADNDVDCAGDCGNGVCDTDETYSTCPQDCCDPDGTAVDDTICHSSCAGVGEECYEIDIGSTGYIISDEYYCDTNCNYTIYQLTSEEDTGGDQPSQPDSQITTGCGDGSCDSDETKCACPEDCGECTGNATETCTEYTCINDTCSIINSTNCCGNDICETNETCSCIDCPCEQGYGCVNNICEEVITQYCGDGTCQSDETCSSCSQDCICETNQICKPERENSDLKGCYTITCGDTYCDTGEDNTNCCLDCGCPNDYTCTNNQCTEIEEEPEEIKPKKTIQVSTPSGVNITVKPGESKHIEVKRENKRVNVSVSITQEIKEDDIKKVNLTVEKVIEHEQVKQISNIKNITLTKKQDKSIYEIQGENDEKFLFLIPVKTKEVIDIDSNTGQIIKREKQDVISAFFIQYIAEPIAKFFSSLFGGNK